VRFSTAKNVFFVAHKITDFVVQENSLNCLYSGGKKTFFAYRKPWGFLVQEKQSFSLCQEPPKFTIFLLWFLSMLRNILDYWC